MEKLTIILLTIVFCTLIFPEKKSAQPKETADLIIRGGTVVTMDAERRVIENGAVAVRGGAVLAVGTNSEITAQFRARQIIDARGKAVIPGLINTHTHIPMTLFRGIGDDLDLQEWLQKYIFPAEAKNVNENFVRLGTQLGLVEMIRGGTTTFCDMYYFEDAVADETARAGMRGVLGETMIDFPAPDNKSHAETVAYINRFAEKWRNHSLITPAVAPHAPYTVSTEHLREARDLSDKYGIPLVTHLAEAATETEFIARKHQGMRPVEYVEKIGFFNDKTIAAHVVQADENDLQTLKKYNVGIGHCPQSNMKLAAGVAPLTKMLALDLPVGLGTDGAASNNDLDMWQEMDTAAKLHKVFTQNPKAVSAKDVFEMATIRGARALHLENKIGSIEIGKRADIVLVGLDAPHQTPLYNIYSHLVYATKASDVETVVVDGKVLMRNKRLLTLDEFGIKMKAREQSAKIRKSLE